MLAGRRPKGLPRFLRGQAGITLLELVVVATVLTVFAGLTALSLAGRSSESRNTARVNDTAEVQRGVDGFNAEHPQRKYPTFDGCLPGQSFDTITKDCKPSASIGAFAPDDPNTYRAIIWEKAFRSRTAAGELVLKSFVPAFVQREPKHAYEHNDSSVWATTSLLDPDGTRDEGLRAPAAGKTPAWVLDKDAKVHVTVVEANY